MKDILKKLCYSELIALPTYDERFDYLKLLGGVGDETFGFDRYLNQIFYTSKLWKSARDFVIARDLGGDLGISDRPIGDTIIVHHMNPLTKEDILGSNEALIDPEFLISVSPKTHRYLHYGKPCAEPKIVLERKPFDTCPWKKGGENDWKAY